MGTAQQQHRHVGKKKLLSLISAAAVTFAASVAFVTGAGPAVADPVEECTATKGAIVAVDFGPFGGDVVRGCDTTPTTGYDLLHEGGFSTEGTQHDGDGFICRIGTDSFDSGTPYPTPATEDCVLTPQATAYWSYWIASPGQKTWSYSPLGAMSRLPKAGDVDAWVFGGTDVGGSTGKPAFTPDEVRAGGGATPGPTDGPTGGPTVPVGEIDVPAAARWVSGQLRDGTHVVDEGSGTPNDFLTTEAAYALAAANGRGPALDKVTAHLAGRTDAYAYPAGTDEAPDATAAARLALLARITGGDARAFGGHDLLGDLAENVCPAGPDSGSPTPGCTAKGDFRGAMYAEGQALAVLALLRGGVERPAGTEERLTRLVCEDGSVTGILISPGEYCDGDPATTGLVALVLDEAGGHEAAVAAMRTYLKKAQLTSGAFPASNGATTGSVAATAYAAQALRALGDGGAADAAVSWLSREQLDGGGFGLDEGATDGALYATGPAVLAGTDTSLVTLVAKAPEPTVPPTAPPTTGAGTPPTTRPPVVGPDLEKGVAFLTRPANLHLGRYYKADEKTGRADFGMTIDGAFALAATGHDDNALRTIVDFLEQGGEDGEGRTLDDWTGAGGKYALGGSMGKAALLAQVVERDPRDFGGRDLIADLADAVCEKPSTAPDRSCAAKGAYTYAPSVFAHALGIMAQVRAGGEKAAEAPIAYLASLQHGSSGAWPSLIPATGDSEVDSTAMAAMTLDLVPGDAHAAAVDKALAWIASQQLPDGGFPGASGNSVNSAGLAVQGLSLDAKKYDKQITKALKFLASQQNKDGGFNVAEEGQRGSDIRASAQAVGGATGISFGVLTRSLDGTTPNPVPSSSAPAIVTPGDSGGGGIVNADGPGDGGGLASTGVQALGLAAAAAVLVLAGWRTVVVARSRRTAAGGSR
ncbi:MULTISPECIES: prenyltransferase/squalene oxidase repeat-containing protein [Streptomyces]|uniref:prenyltransferase/squalene oxidase repeat-containing protein n=1 Tax=Streptomyces TaxID=1883 RepID=UPI00205B9238|nr:MULTISPECIES: prenyltransferase/squalene oxidase repeat-containing protein [Streptomyces]UPT40152.1 terpene cyclase/mutase family protein [Streptomyces sp. WAC00303]WIY74444.1 terpene cyclase/mutase family protein [Streptomyces anulatus]